MKSAVHILAIMGILFPFTAYASPQAPGDDCNTGVTIAGTGTFNWNNALNTTSGFDGGDPATCFSSSNGSNTGTNSIRQDVFFVWAVPGDGDYVFDTENSSGIDDTKMSIHAGFDCAATCIASDDDSGGTPALSSLIQLTGLMAGDQYLIQVGSWNDTSGTGDCLLNITHVSTPPNDTCLTPQMIAGLGTHSWNNSAATTSGFDGGDPLGCFSPANGAVTGANAIRKDLFFAWTVPAGGGDFQIDTEYSTGATDTKMSIHAGSDCSATCVASDDDGGIFPPLTSKITLTGLTAGDQYLIQVGTWNDTSPSGNGLLNISGPTPPPFNNLCSSASPLVGNGSWPFDTTAATTSGFNGGTAAVCGLGSLNMGPDLFYQWTASTAGDFQFDTCGSLYDTKISLHQGSGCAAVCAGYNDDGPCGMGASEAILMGVLPGDQILVQVGGYSGSSGIGSLTIAPWVDPCAGLGQDGFEENDSCTTAQAIVDGSYPGLTVFRDDLDIYSLTVPAGGTLNVICNHIFADGDIDLFLFDSSTCMDDPAVDPTCSPSLACGWQSSAPESLTWVNTTGTDADCTLRVSLWPSGMGDCAQHELVISGVQVGSSSLFCDPGATNSSGASVTLAPSNFTGPGVFHLKAIQGPINQFGYFLVSGSAVDPGVIVSAGELCLGAPIGRYNSNAGPGLNSIGRFDVFGVFQNLSGTSTNGAGFDVPAALPNPPGGVIATGHTWHFQLWYRDGPASNFSSGLSVSF